MGRIPACEQKTQELTLKGVKVVLECMAAKRIDLFESIRMDEYVIFIVAFFAKDIEELACGGAIEIADKL